VTEPSASDNLPARFSDSNLTYVRADLLETGYQRLSGPALIYPKTIDRPGDARMLRGEVANVGV
jgi:hypothetical protein